MDYKKYYEIHSLCLSLKRNLISLKGDEKAEIEEKLKKSVKLLEGLCMEGIDMTYQRTQRTKKEIVFFPYKASMWDSLESIWMAAKADPDCITKVIPIPYYTTDTEGNLTVYNYEG